MILHIITREGREAGVAKKVSKFVNLPSEKYTFTYDKLEGERYHKGFVLLRLDNESHIDKSKIESISEVILVKEISIEDAQTPYYQPQSQLNYEVKPSTLVIGGSYTIKKGALKDLTFKVEKIEGDEILGKALIFGRDTDLKLDSSFIL